MADGIPEVVPDSGPDLSRWVAAAEDVPWLRAPDALWTEGPRSGTWFSGGRLNAATGLGLRYYTPFAPIRLDAPVLVREAAQPREPGRAHRIAGEQPRAQELLARLSARSEPT